MPPTISLTMIVRDESVNLPACLASCDGLFDELIVVDTGSTDSTKAIAAAAKDKHGRPAKVFDFAWCDDFAAARNESLRHATGDWVFWMDADDRLDSIHRPRAAYVLDSLKAPDGVFYFDCVLPQPAGKAAEVVHQVRLFPRFPEAQWMRRVHEYISIPSRPLIGYHTDVQILHVGYLDDAIRAAKSRRNLHLLRVACDESPSDHDLLYYLGVECFRNGLRDEAREHLRRSREMCAASGLQVPYEYKRDEMLRYLLAIETIVA